MLPSGGRRQQGQPEAMCPAPEPRGWQDDLNDGSLSQWKGYRQSTRVVCHLHKGSSLTPDKHQQQGCLSTGGSTAGGHTAAAGRQRTRAWAPSGSHPGPRSPPPSSGPGGAGTDGTAVCSGRPLPVPSLSKSPQLPVCFTLCRTSQGYVVPSLSATGPGPGPHSGKASSGRKAIAQGPQTGFTSRTAPLVTGHPKEWQ